MSSRNEHIFTLAQDWPRWCRSKQMYCAPQRRNILDQSATGEPPDAPLSPEMASFDVALRSLDEKRRACVLVVYCGLRTVSQLVIASGLSRRQCYILAHEGADRIAGMMREQLRISDAMRAEVLFGGEP